MAADARDHADVGLAVGRGAGNRARPGADVVVAEIISQDRMSDHFRYSSWRFAPSLFLEGYPRSSERYSTPHTFFVKSSSTGLKNTPRPGCFLESG